MIKMQIEDGPEVRFNYISITIKLINSILEEGRKY